MFIEKIYSGRRKGKAMGEARIISPGLIQLRKVFLAFVLVNL